MENHGQQGARHGGAALGPAARGVAGCAVAVAPAQARPAAQPRDPDVTGQAAAAAAAHHRRQPRRPGPRVARAPGAFVGQRRAHAHVRVPRPARPRVARAAAARAASGRVRLPLLRAARGGPPHRRAQQERRHLAHSGRATARLTAGSA